MGVLTCVYTTEKNYVRNIRQLGVHTFVYTTKNTSYETYEKWGYSLVYTTKKNYVRNIRQLGVHTFVYTTKKTSYETYEKWGYSLVCILLRKKMTYETYDNWGYTLVHILLIQFTYQTFEISNVNMLLRLVFKTSNFTLTLLLYEGSQRLH